MLQLSSITENRTSGAVACVLYSISTVCQERPVIENKIRGRRSAWHLLGNKGAHIYNGNKEVVCDICGLSFHTKDELQNHECLFSEKMYETFKDTDDLSKHSYKQTDVFTCKSCNHTYTTLKRLNSHKCTYCATCGNIYRTYKAKIKHFCFINSTVTQTNERHSHCNNQPLQQTYSNINVTSSMPLKIQKSDIPEMKLKQNSVNDEESKDQSQESKRMIMCHLCKKKFKTNIGLLKHKCAFCKNCQKTFSRYSRKMKHKCSQNNLNNQPSNGDKSTTVVIDSNFDTIKTSTSTFIYSDTEDNQNVTTEQTVDCEFSPSKSLTDNKLSRQKTDELSAEPTGIYICLKCKHTFKSQKGFQHHKCTYCSVCNKIFKTYKIKMIHECSDNMTEKDSSPCEPFQGNIQLHKEPLTMETINVKQPDAFAEDNPNELVGRKDKGSCYSSMNSTKYTHIEFDQLTESSESSHEKVPFTSEIPYVVADTPQSAGYSDSLVQSTINTSIERQRLVDLVGGFGTYVPDDVMEKALDIMRQYRPDMSAYIGQITPAQMEYIISSGKSLKLTPKDKLCINFHLVDSHWVCSTYDPSTNCINVYDSLFNSQRVIQLKRQFYILYGRNFSRINYIPITQQRTDPACGAFAVAAAFCCLLGVPPQTQNFVIGKMREHLKLCLQQHKLIVFPTHDSLIGNYFSSQAISQEQHRKNICNGQQKIEVCKTQKKNYVYQQKDKNKVAKPGVSTSKEKRKEKLRLGIRKKRCNSEWRKQEAEKDKLRKRNFRQENLLQSERDRFRKRHTRQIPELKQSEIERDRLRKQKKRQIPEVKQSEMDKDKSRKLQKRQIPEVRQFETARDILRKRQKRQIPKVKQSEAVKDRLRKLQRRQIPQIKQIEKARDILRKRQKRQIPEVKQSETVRERLRKMQKRQIPQIKQIEKARDILRKRQKRQIPEVKQSETVRDRLRKRKNRQIPEVRQIETAHDRFRKRQKRQLKDFRDLEVFLDRIRKKQKRQLLAVRQLERFKDRIRKKESRKHQYIKQLEAQRDRLRKQYKRKSAEVRIIERIIDRTRKQIKRSQAHIQIIEKLRTRKCMRKRRSDPFIQTVYREIARERLRKKRQNSSNRIAENNRRKMKRQNQISSVDTAAAYFKNIMKKGCSFVCTCCYQLWFYHSVIPAYTVRCPNDTLKNKCFTGKISFDNQEWICLTCAASIRKNRLPTLARENGMVFPKKPNELKLNQLEERLIAPINPFMQLRELPSGGQVSIRGNVVNVPSDNLRVVSTLPRRLDDSGTIPVKLKRRLRYKSHYMYENIRPEKCLNAVNYLLSKALFQQYVLEGIDEDWLNNHIPSTRKTEWGEFLQPIPDRLHTTLDIQEDNTETFTSALPSLQGTTDPHYLCQGTECLDKSPTNVITQDQKVEKSEDTDSDNWSEEDNSVEGQNELPVPTDTLMFDEILDADSSKCICLAPSEGNQPISATTNDLEELAFPRIFCGDRRKSNKERERPVKYSEICKSELRREDRRVGSSTNNLFFKVKKLQYKHLQDKVWLSMKRIQSKGQKLTAGQVRDAENMDNLVRLDEGFRIFRTLRGSPPYWETAKKDIFAMLRQLGLPTWFLTLSAAELRWTDLLHTLGLIVDQQNYTNEEIDAFSYHTKCRLIKADPVTTARFFDFRVQVFFKHFLQTTAAPIGNVNDFFFRVEFQQRGSPHIHSLIWVEDAPLYNTDDLQNIYNFLDRYVSTSASDAELEDLLTRQTHRHTHTCRKKGNICRFHFPLPPMGQTIILKPLKDLLPLQLKVHKQNWLKINESVQNLKQDTDITFPQFLESLGLSNEEYILAIMSTLKEDRVFMKRDPNAVKVNAYNKPILQTWEANMDIQYITDPYSCAMYIVSYISKGQRGMSELMKRACEDARKHSSNIREQVKTIANKFLRHVEISAQEAVYLGLQLPLRRSTRGFLFINTSPKEDRPFILKSQDILEQLPEDSEDIKCSNIIQRYTERPKRLENICLADFAAWYDVSQQKKKKRTKTDDEVPETDMEDNQDDDLDNVSEEYGANNNDMPEKITLTSKTKMKKRKKKKIIRYVRYCKKKDPENYYRESLMLFSPWWSEEYIIGNSSTYEEEYEHVKTELELKRLEYERKAEDLDLAEELLQNEPEEDIWDETAPNTNYQNMQDQDKDVQEGNSNENLFTEYDVGTEFGIPGTDFEEENIRNRVSDIEFRAMVQNLNRKQREIFYHILETAKVGDKQQFIFLSGGAGVGKTQVIKSVYQALLRHFNTISGENPELLRVLLVAPTGKAAYLINGRTIHSAFHIPANQGFQYKRLNNEMRNTIRCQYQHLKIIIIDEVSMCGSRMLHFINLRMQEVTQTTLPFGGVHIIAVGDLFQLHPVQDNWIFQLSKDLYAPLAPNVWTDNFRLFELTQIMRQKEDGAFAEILNRLREGQQTNLDLKVLRSRMIDKKNPSYPKTATHIMYFNRCVEKHNTDMYLTAKTDKILFKAHDIVIGDIDTELKQKILDRAPEKPNDGMGLGMFFRTALGLRNEMTVNIDTTDGLVNGASCVTKHYTYGNTDRPIIIWVQFDHPDIGTSLRSKSQHLYDRVTDKCWTPIHTVTREFPVGRYKNAKILRRQFPLQLACAKTVHRSQGDTIDAAVLSLPNQRRAHLHYVAFSRVTSLQKVYVLGEFETDKITVSQEVQNEMKRLRTSAILPISVQLYDIPDKFFKIVFHNCQSLKLHIKDLETDNNLTAADIFMCVETKLSSSDPDTHIQLPNFSLFRNDFQQSRSAYGSAVYFKDKSHTKCYSLNYNAIEITLLIIEHPLQLSVICIYCRPKETFPEIKNSINFFKRHLSEKQNIVVMGDFNIHANQTDLVYKKLQQEMNKLGLEQLIYEPTTDGLTTIDHIYTNMKADHYQSGVLERYFSYHKALWIALDKNALEAVQ